MSLDPDGLERRSHRKDHAAREAMVRAVEPHGMGSHGYNMLATKEGAPPLDS